MKMSSKEGMRTALVLRLTRLTDTVLVLKARAHLVLSGGLPILVECVPITRPLPIHVTATNDAREKLQGIALATGLARVKAVRHSSRPRAVRQGHC